MSDLKSMVWASVLTRGAVIQVLRSKLDSKADEAYLQHSGLKSR